MLVCWRPKDKNIILELQEAPPQHLKHQRGHNMNRARLDIKNCWQGLDLTLSYWVLETTLRDKEGKIILRICILIMGLSTYFTLTKIISVTIPWK